MENTINHKLVAKSHYNLGNTQLGFGRTKEALESFKKAIKLIPEFPEAHSNLGFCLKKLGRLDESIESLNRAIEIRPDYPEAHLNLGDTLYELGRLEEAEVNYRKAIDIRSDFVEAHNHLGIIIRMLGRPREAEEIFRTALKIEPDNASVLSNLAFTLNEMGLRKDALKYFQKHLYITRGEVLKDQNHISFNFINKAKIDHDIEQFQYLANSGKKNKKFKELATLYKTVSSEINFKNDTETIQLSNKHKNLLSKTYNRPINILEAPKLKGSSLGNDTNVSQITENYFDHEFGLTYIDNFLNLSALKNLREFLLGSTIWFDNFQDGGYLGAYLNVGMASPLVLQIAEDLRKKFPKIFKNHSVKQIWAYKYDSRASDKNNPLSGIKVHADMAAINVNFWITPDSANLDSSSGGLVVHHTESPSDWLEYDYNVNRKKIQKEIQKGHQRKTVVPYKENRAVLFNSSLFHETDNINFKEGYENRRINVTILFGNRLDR